MLRFILIAVPAFWITTVAVEVHRVPVPVVYEQFSDTAGPEEG